MERPWLRNYEPGVPSTLNYPPRPLHANLEESAHKYPHATATVFLNAKLTYAQLNALADGLLLLSSSWESRRAIGWRFMWPTVRSLWSPTTGHSEQERSWLLSIRSIRRVKSSINWWTAEHKSCS